ncbi:3-dehydroquinate synthase [Sphingomicrobium sp. XHP0235]|uniref:3-dehydroquinate synthase n=1 Tax=Sphingomicrobium aquimarinum TaxID=3133971 RepID=UPI0031FF4211
MTQINVPGRDGTTYPVHIGPLENSWSHAPRRPLALITDPHVWALHGHRWSSIAPVEILHVPRGEEAKDWAHLQQVIAFLSARNHQRGEPLIAFGGGAIGDLAGLAASLYRRGVPVIQVPTTLLAQVDSSVGGKTAIDAEGQKNLVGAFHPPVSVHADPVLLTTLEPREMRAGLAETLKYGLIGDQSFYEDLTSGGIGKHILDLKPDAITKAVATAVRSKADAVRGDLEDTKGRRALLNLGHTFGHAIEAVSGLGTLLHGEAVAIGMVLAARFSAQEGRCEKTVPERLVTDFRHLGLPTSIGDAAIGDGAALLEPMLADKKNENGNLALILLRDIGAAFMDRDVPQPRISAFLKTL